MKSLRYAVLILTVVFAALLLCSVAPADPVLDSDGTDAVSGVVDASAESDASEVSEEAEEPKVSVKAKDTGVKDVLASLAEQSKEKILVEKSVKASVTTTMKDVSLETALDAVCTAGKYQWRKLYINEDSDLLEKPDRLASTVRLMSGLGFPNMVLAGSSTKKVMVHFEEEKAVKNTEDTCTEELGMVRVYLVTNDAAIAEDVIAGEESEEDEKSKSVEDYTETQKKLMDDFMAMTPEEQEMVLMESFALMDRIGPEYMSAVMQAMMNVDEMVMRDYMSRQSEMLFYMDTNDRRRLMAMQIRSMQYLTPEQMQIIQEDAAAVQKMLQEETGQ